MESLSVGSKPMVALALVELLGNTGHLILAMGGLDNKIHLYCGERTGNVCISDFTLAVYFLSYIIFLLLKRNFCFLVFVMLLVCSCL